MTGEFTPSTSLVVQSSQQTGTELVTGDVIIQSGARAGNDVVAGNVHHGDNIYQAAPHAAGIVEKLLLKLNAELENDQKAQAVIERLQRFYINRSHDGIVGLKNKLTKSGREETYIDAIEMKEMFVKLMEQWSLYASAQQIFVFLLARAERQFNDIIVPQISTLDTVGVNTLTNALIVEPTVAECGDSVFQIDHNVATGMIYWLAEQCFVRWHK
jgi:hypothetical protein